MQLHIAYCPYREGGVAVLRQQQQNSSDSKRLEYKITTYFSLNIIESFAYNYLQSIYNMYIYPNIPHIVPYLFYDSTIKPCYIDHLPVFMCADILTCVCLYM